MNTESIDAMTELLEPSPQEKYDAQLSAVAGKLKNGLKPFTCDECMSESIDKLAEALALAQKDISSPVKDSKNPFYKSDYASLHAVIQASKPMHEYGLSLLQLNGTETLPGTHYATVRTILMHKSGQFVSGKTRFEIPPKPAKKPDKEEKIQVDKMGVIYTYLRRYSASGMIFLAQQDTDGEEEIQKRKQSNEILMHRDRLAMHNKALKSNLDSVMYIKEKLDVRDFSAANKALSEISKHDKTALWLAPSKGGIWTPKEIVTMKSNEFVAARNKMFKSQEEPDEKDQEPAIFDYDEQ